MLLIEQIQAPKTDASTALLAEGAKRGAVTQQPIVRNQLKEWLRAWSEEDSQLTQHKFWRFHDQLRDFTLHEPEFITLNEPNFIFETKPVNDFFNFQIPDVSDISLSSVNYDKWVSDKLAHYCSILDQNRMEISADQTSFVVDGLQRLNSISLLDFTHEISAKSARRAIKAALTEIENLADEQSDLDFIALISSALSKKAAAELTLVVRVRCIISQRPREDETRHRVLCFFIHTGNSPPTAIRNSRLAVSWALVDSIPNVRREEYASIQRQKVARNIRNTLREQRARTCINRGTQGHAYRDCSRQPTRCGHSRSHHSLARCA